jgi:sterol 14-demethylase
MGLLQTIAAPLANSLSTTSTSLVLALAFATFVVLSIVLNVLKQLLIKNPNEPPIVFHWVPFIGSTVTYGMDPYKFFFSCREKVCWPRRSDVRLGRHGQC